MFPGRVVPAHPFTLWGEGEIVTTTSGAPIPILIATVVGEEMLVVGKDDRFAARMGCHRIFLRRSMNSHRWQ